jgi:hypothetical protein
MRSQLRAPMITAAVAVDRLALARVSSSLRDSWPSGAGQFFARDIAMVRFLERYSYPVSYTTSESVDSDPSQLPECFNCAQGRFSRRPAQPPSRPAAQPPKGSRWHSQARCALLHHFSDLDCPEPSHRMPLRHLQRFIGARALQDVETGNALHRIGK